MLPHDFSKYAPAPGAIPGTIADAPAAPAVALASAIPSPAAPAPDVRFAPDAPSRRAPVPLAYPIMHNGTRIETVFVRRLMAIEVRAYVAAIQAGQEAHLPMYETEDGTPLSRAALDLLDSDDFDAVDAKALDFLPLALRADPT